MLQALPLSNHNPFSDPPPAPSSTVDPQFYIWWNTVTNALQAAAAAEASPTSVELQPPVRRHIHPLRYPHVWCILGGLTTQLTLTSSFFPVRITEELVFGTIVFLLGALIFSLTQDIPFADPKPPAPKGNFWARFQEKAGIRPQIRPNP